MFVTRNYIHRSSHTGMLSHACDPNMQEIKAGGGQVFKAILGYIVRPHFKEKTSGCVVLA